MYMSPASQALLITPNNTIQALLEIAVEEEGLQAISFVAAQPGLQFLKDNTPQLIVLDEGLEPDAFAIASRLKMIKRLKEVPVVLLMGEENDRTRLTAEISRVDHIFAKPIDRKRFKGLLQALLKNPRP